MSLEPVVFILSKRALGTARLIAATLDGAPVHGPKRCGGEVERAFGDFGSEVRRCFQAGHPIVAVLAAGAIVRALAPLLRDKTVEAPVVVVAEDGSAVIPLLGGHHGANRLAQRIGLALEVPPALTTASDLHFGVALDDPPEGYVLGNPGDLKAFTVSLLGGEPLQVEGFAPWIEKSALPRADDAGLRISITAHRGDGSPRQLVYHPKVLAIGVGCERGTPPQELGDLVDRVLLEASLAEASVAGIYSIDAKSGEAAVHDVGERLRAPVRFFSASRLEKERSRLVRPSEAVFRAVGCHGVAEAAALAAVGSEGRLLVSKEISGRATCAVGVAPSAFDGTNRGRPRGGLVVVGIGPGHADWRTAEAETWLRAADAVVGYRGYLDLLGDLGAAARTYPYPLGQEEARARRALDLAAAGEQVALISSGDAGIFAMASLVYELLQRDGGTQWPDVSVEVAPGISALQAAAARVGAPLGHDFCAISLSDLMTPRDVILRRLRAAAEGDFVVALYNPRSARRRELLRLAAEILGARRPPRTPVVVARNLGRAEEVVRVISLDQLAGDPGVDMRSIVLVGSSETCAFTWQGRAAVFTPRGYSAKRSGGTDASP